MIFLMEEIKATAKRQENLSMLSIHLYSPLHKTVPTLIMTGEQKHKVKSHNPPRSSKLTISRETHSGPKQFQQAQSQDRPRPYLSSEIILAF